MKKIITWINGTYMKGLIQKYFGNVSILVPHLFIKIVLQVHFELGILEGEHIGITTP